MKLPLKRILCVEDESDIRTIAKMVLEVGGFTVEVCSSGVEAVQKAPEFAPDLIMLDVMMPGMDGPATLEAMRQLPQTAKTPIIFMTAKAQSHEVAQYKMIGGLDVIVKPFDPMTLASKVQDIWSKHHA